VQRVCQGLCDGPIHEFIEKSAGSRFAIAIGNPVIAIENLGDRDAVSDRDHDAPPTLARQRESS
jgi:hypothetical protein